MPKERHYVKVVLPDDQLTWEVVEPPEAFAAMLTDTRTETGAPFWFKTTDGEIIILFPQNLQYLECSSEELDD